MIHTTSKAPDWLLIVVAVALAALTVAIQGPTGMLSVLLCAFSAWGWTRLLDDMRRG